MLPVQRLALVQSPLRELVAANLAGWCLRGLPTVVGIACGATYWAARHGIYAGINLVGTVVLVASVVTLLAAASLLPGKWDCRPSVLAYRSP